MNSRKHSQWIIHNDAVNSMEKGHTCRHTVLKQLDIHMWEKNDS